MGDSERDTAALVAEFRSQRSTPDLIRWCRRRGFSKVDSMNAAANELERRNDEAVSVCRELAESLDVAEEFIDRVTGWTGDDPDEAFDVNAQVGRALKLAASFGPASVAVGEAEGPNQEASGVAESSGPSAPVPSTPEGRALERAFIREMRAADDEHASVPAYAWWHQYLARRLVRVVMERQANR